jgi:hypothetical protein
VTGAPLRVSRYAASACEFATFSIRGDDLGLRYRAIKAVQPQ